MAIARNSQTFVIFRAPSSKLSIGTWPVTRIVFAPPPSQSSLDEALIHRSHLLLSWATTVASPVYCRSKTAMQVARQINAKYIKDYLLQTVFVTGESGYTPSLKFGVTLTSRH